MYRLKCSPRRVVSGNCSDCQASAVAPVNDGHAPEPLGSMAIERQIGRGSTIEVFVLPFSWSYCRGTRLTSNYTAPRGHLMFSSDQMHAFERRGFRCSNVRSRESCNLFGDSMRQILSDQRIFSWDTLYKFSHLVGVTLKSYTVLLLLPSKAVKQRRARAFSASSD